MNKKELKNKIEKRSKNLRFDKSLSRFFIFVLLASLFWFLNALSKDYNTEILTRIKYTNFPQNKLISNTLPDRLKMNVVGPGFSLIRHKLFPLWSVVKLNIINISKNELNAPVQNSYIIKMDAIKSQIEKQLADDIKLQDVYPKEILLIFSDASQRTVKIKPKVNVNCKKRFVMVGLPTAAPEKIIVKGPSSIVDTLKYIYTDKLDFFDLNAPVKRNVSLEAIDNVEFSKKRVVVKINVEELTNGKITVPIHVKNLPDSLRVNILPKNIDITYFVNMGDYNNIKVTDFYAVLDFEKLKNNPSATESVRLEKYPATINHIKFTPQKVEFFIQKKE